jgi:hypothetical protein
MDVKNAEAHVCSPCLIKQALNLGRKHQERNYNFIQSK